MTVPDKTPTVTYAGVILGGATAYDWELRSGVAPVERAFTVSRARGEALRDYLGRAAVFEIVGPRKTTRIEQIYLLEILPGDDPNNLRIRLADRRWLWPKRWVATTFNLRRTTGERFLFGEGRLENKLIQPEIKYARYSLALVSKEDQGEPTTRPWTAKEALTWLVETQLETPTRWDDEPVQVELQDVVDDDPGPAAVERVLAYLPGFDFYVDELGVCVFFDRYSGKEAAVLAALPPPHRDGAWVEMVDRRAIRPAKVVVLFTVESEMRLDHVEPESSTQEASEDQPTLTQVGPLPDVTLEVGGQVLARSSWVDLLTLFATWGPFGIFNREISFGELRRHALKYGWAQFEQAWGNNPLIPPDAVNMARAHTAARSWRRFFRIDRYWMQRIASIRPYRAAIINPETGAYAPAVFYSDWCRRPSYKGFARATDQNVNQGWAVRGWADLLADSEPAPARISVVDEQAGILSVEPQQDPFGLSQAMIFGYPEEGALPSQVLGDANRAGKEVYARWDRVVVEGRWRCSVVLTVVPASPNTTARFYSVEVPAETISPSPGPSDGPTVYARVFPGVLTARMAWRDDSAEAIRAAIKGEGPWYSDLLVNVEQVEDVARATAARIYDTLRDRPLGGGSVDMRPELRPTGTISSVRHSMEGGETRSHVVFSAVTQPADVWRYLNASTRRAILRINHQFPAGGGA